MGEPRSGFDGVGSYLEHLKAHAEHAAAWLPTIWSRRNRQRVTEWLCEYQARVSHTFAAHMMTVTDTVEISADGETWTPVVEDKWTKVEPAAKR